MSKTSQALHKADPKSWSENLRIKSVGLVKSRVDFADSHHSHELVAGPEYGAIRDEDLNSNVDTVTSRPKDSRTVSPNTFPRRTRSGLLTSSSTRYDFGRLEDVDLESISEDACEEPDRLRGRVSRRLLHANHYETDVWGRANNRASTYGILDILATSQPALAEEKLEILAQPVPIQKELKGGMKWTAPFDFDEEDEVPESASTKAPAPSSVPCMATPPAKSLQQELMLDEYNEVQEDDGTHHKSSEAIELWRAMAAERSGQGTAVQKLRLRRATLSRIITSDWPQPLNLNKPLPCTPPDGARPRYETPVHRSPCQRSPPLTPAHRALHTEVNTYMARIVDKFDFQDQSSVLQDPLSAKQDNPVDQLRGQLKEYLELTTSTPSSNESRSNSFKSARRLPLDSPATPLTSTCIDMNVDHTGSRISAAGHGSLSMCSLEELQNDLPLTGRNSLEEIEHRFEQGLRESPVLRSSVYSQCESLSSIDYFFAQTRATTQNQPTSHAPEMGKMDGGQERGR